MEPSHSKEPFVVRTGRWLTKRRSVLLAPLFSVALLAARPATHPGLELLQDLLSMACLLGGTGLRLVAASYHDSSHHSEPITAGPYAWIRHPLYLANFLIGLSIVLLAGWWPMVLVYVFFFIPLHAVIARSEEIHLSWLYGEKYEVYRRVVPAFLPWKPYPKPRYGSRNEFKLQKGQERWKVLGYLAGAMGILLFKRFHPMLKASVLQPLPGVLWLIGSATVGLAVVFRPKIRRAWLRSCQTALAVGTALFLALHVPGVWPGCFSVKSPNLPVRVQPSAELRY